LDRLSLLVAQEERRFQGGIDILLRSSAERLKPPAWASSIVVVDSLDDSPDSVLFVLNGTPSSRIRNIFFDAFRRSIPCAGLSYGEITGTEPVVAKLSGWDRLWSFDTGSTARQLLFGKVQDWIVTLEKDSFPFPSGRELLEEWGTPSGETLDDQILNRAEEILDSRGFVCLSGSLGAGKTTLSRHLLNRSSLDGLKPVEHISPDLDGALVESILKGPEDCALLFDIDTMRRTAPLYPLDLWMIALSQLIRATEKRRCLILASSSPRMAGVFDLFSEAHIRLPEPAESRSWRLEQGERALSRFLNMDDIAKAEMILLAMFEPVVPEVLFKDTLFGFWRRLFIIIHQRFPSNDELEELYSNSHAATGAKPFRRLNFRGETRIVAGDTVMMASIDNVIRELLRQSSPLVRILCDTLLTSIDPVVRKAGYTLFFFYELLQPEEKASLLYSISREEKYEDLVDPFSMLFRREEIVDEAGRSLCENVVETGTQQARRAIAFGLGTPWVRRNERMQPLLEGTISSSDPIVRAEFMRSLDTWRVSDDPGGYYRRLMLDEGSEVRARLLYHLGSRFPDIDPSELKVLSKELENGDDVILTSLASGLMNRRPVEFVEEFTDLLWVLMDRLSGGGKAMLARNIGGRLRFFSPDIRASLISDIRTEDEFNVTQCLLMNYRWLEWSELEKLWSMIMERTPVDLDYASMVLRYFSVLEEKEKRLLINIVLTFESYGGREALAQLLASGRKDLARASLEVVSEIVEKGPVDQKARLPWFILWNRKSFDGKEADVLRVLTAEPNPAIRSAVASSIRRLGYGDAGCRSILRELASDPERAVRAAAGEALGELSVDDSSERESEEYIHTLLADDDPFVRIRTLAGFARAVGIPVETKALAVVQALGDEDAAVRRGALFSLDFNIDICSSGGVDTALGNILVDPNEEVRLEAIRLVTSCPDLISSENLRKRLPDLFLDRLTAGAAIADELNTARQIQLDLLPDGPPVLDEYDIEVFYRPAREVGGDYYDFFSLPNSNTGLAIADVMGKGIPAALTMAGLKGNMGAYISSLFSISEIVGKVNESVAAAGEGSTLVGLFYGVINSSTGELTYVNAGHNPPLLFKREGEVIQLDTGGLLLGFSAGSRYEFGIEMIETGDVLVLYTDGITEVMDASGKEFGSEGLCDVILAAKDLSSRQITSDVLSAIRDFGSGAPQSDDQTLVVLKHR